MRVTRIALPAAGLLALLTWVGGTALADTPQATSTAIDSSECAACHEDAVSAVQRTYHGTVEQSCAACHKGAAEHLKTQTEGGDAPAPSFKGKKASEVDEICLTCHEKTHPTWTGGMHERRGVSCINCHSIHNFKSQKAQLKAVTASAVCTTCHVDIRSKLMRTSHHPVREGVIGCESCHNPHDATRPKMIKADWTNELCYKCHAEKRGPFLWEHAPVRENCLNCHDPHGSNHDKLLVAKLPYLCQRCHLNTRHPGTLYDASNSATNPASATNRAVEHACKNCHQNIHGSNAPSGVYLGR